MKQPSLPLRNLSRHALVAAALVLIVLATLVPSGDFRPQFYWRIEISDVLVNLCLYLPLGVSLASEGVRPRAIVLLVVLLSGAIELMQGTVIPGRRGSPADIVTNLAGALLGVLAYRTLLLVRRTPTPSRVAGVAAVVLFPLGFWAVSGALLAPVAPETLQWYGQWAHHFANTEPFRGSILSVALQGRPVPDDRVDSTEALRAAARRGPLRLDVTLLAGGTAGGLTHLASVADGEGHFVLGLEQLGDDLLVSWWSRGAGLRLRAPRVTFPALLRAAPGERLSLHASVTGSRAAAWLERGTETRSDSRRISPLTGWRNLIPTRDLTPDGQRLFDLVWTLGCAGYLVFALRLLRSLRFS